MFVLSLFLLLTLSGCFSGCVACEAGGIFAERGVDHCYQWLSVQTGDTTGCEKIPGTGFEGQNPPKDKCYLLIAEKEKDPQPCANIVGGFNSYTQDECYQGVGAGGGSADDCDGLAAADEMNCRTGVARGQNSESNPPSCGEGYAWVAGGLGGGSCVKTVPATEKTEPEEPTTETAPEITVPDVPPKTPAPEKDAVPGRDFGPSRPAWEWAVDGLADLTDEIDQGIAAAGEATANLVEGVKDIFTENDKDKTPSLEQEQGTRLSELLSDVEDEEARSTIITTFIEQRSQRDAMTVKEQQELLNDIKEQYEFGQQMDEKANTIKANTVDQLTEKVDELVGEKMDEAKEGAWEWFKDKTYGWVKGRSPENEKYVEAAKLAEERYNQAVEKYNEALESYNKGKDYFDKAQKAYDEVKQVMDNVRRLQDKVSDGKLTPGQAQAIKGGVLLGKGLEYATKYIPVFGDTISEVTAGTFQATMKFAEKRGERTTKLNNCIEDPEHCDPNGISAY